MAININFNKNYEPNWFHEWTEGEGVLQNRERTEKQRKKPLQSLVSKKKWKKKEIIYMNGWNSIVHSIIKIETEKQKTEAWLQMRATQFA